MNIAILLLANSLFLLVVFLILISVLFRNGFAKKSHKVKDDLKKIKEQISKDEDE
ncbi:MAG: hypothetical protein KJ600_00380 [Nanoarchaeota archaeon]|nr:hypothetical protein [Nanoarchaeota archaeon]MBU1103000.1 hypothetical protein [Nanoarchaeota archaeon]